MGSAPLQLMLLLGGAGQGPELQFKELLQLAEVWRWDFPPLWEELGEGGKTNNTRVAGIHYRFLCWLEVSMSDVPWLWGKN